MSENAEAPNDEELNCLRSELEAHKRRFEQLDSQLSHYEELKKALPVVKALEFRTQKFDDPNYMQALLQKAILQTPLYRWGRFFVVSFVLLGAVVWTGGTLYSGIQINMIQDQAAKVSRQSENFLGTVNDRVREITEDALNSTQKFAQQTADLKRVAERHVATIEENLNAARTNAKAIATAKEDLSQAVAFQTLYNGVSKHEGAQLATTTGKVVKALEGQSLGIADEGSARLAAASRNLAGRDKITIWNVWDRLDRTAFYILCGVLFVAAFTGLVWVVQIMRWIASSHDRKGSGQTARGIAHQRLSDPEFRPEPGH